MGLQYFATSAGSARQYSGGLLARIYSSKQMLCRSGGSAIHGNDDHTTTTVVAVQQSQIEYLMVIVSVIFTLSSQ